MLTVFIILLVLIVIGLMAKVSNERNKATRLSGLSSKASEARANFAMHQMKLSTMSPEEAFLESLTDEERAEYLSLTTALERMDFTVNKAEERVKHQGELVKELAKAI